MKKRKILIEAEIIEQRIKQLGQAITTDYAGQDLTLICILKGSLYFFADLSRNIDMDVNLEFMRVKSYENEDSTGEVSIILDLQKPIKDKNVIVVEDIIDSGKTLAFLLKALSAREPKSLKLCTLLDKPDRREIKNIKVDYVGFKIPNRFVVGYGLDINEQYRNLPDLSCLVDENDNLDDLNHEIQDLKRQLKSKR